MSFKYRYRKQIIIIFLFIFTVVSGSFSIYHFNNQKKRNVQKKEVLLSSKKSPKIKKVSQEKDNDDEIYYKVDIKGEVQNPGLYSLKEGSRVSDVIALAGGLTVNGDTSVINLSKKIVDEMVIIIYSREEVENFGATKDKEEKVIEDCQNSYEGVVNQACISSDLYINSNSQVEETTISINTATVEQLQTLSGIGYERAKGIVSYREEHGNFQNIEEIKNVNGIGDSIFDKIKDYITL